MSNTTTSNEKQSKAINITEMVGDQARSPYQLAKLITSIEGREMHPQMLYSYVKKGYLPSYTNELGHHVVSPETQVEFITRRQMKREATK